MLYISSATVKILNGMTYIMIIKWHYTSDTLAGGEAYQCSIEIWYVKLYYYYGIETVINHHPHALPSPNVNG